MVVFTRNFLPDRTSIKTSGMISSAKKLSIKSSTNLLECFLSHMYRQNANFGPCQAKETRVLKTVIHFCLTCMVKNLVNWLELMMTYKGACIWEITTTVLWLYKTNLKILIIGCFKCCFTWKLTFLMMTEFDLKSFMHLAPVVQKVDSTIHWINL